jgi:hypothetical protein
LCPARGRWCQWETVIVGVRNENRQKESNLIEMEKGVKFKDVKRAQSLTDYLETRLQGAQADKGRNGDAWMLQQLLDLVAAQSGPAVSIQTVSSKPRRRHPSLTGDCRSRCNIPPSEPSGSYCTESLNTCSV